MKKNEILNEINTMYDELFWKSYDAKRENGAHEKYTIMKRAMEELIENIDMVSMADYTKLEEEQLLYVIAKTKYRFKTRAFNAYHVDMQKAQTISELILRCGIQTQISKIINGSNDRTIVFRRLREYLG